MADPPTERDDPDLGGRQKTMCKLMQLCGLADEGVHTDKEGRNGEIITIVFPEIRAGPHVERLRSGFK